MRSFLYFLVVIVLGVGAYFIATWNKSDKSNVEQNNQTDFYAGWREYNNEEFGFHLRYPSDHRFKEEVDEQSEYTGHLFSVDFFKMDEQNPENFLSFIGVGIYENPKKLTVENWIKENSQNHNPYEVIDINSNQAIRFSINEMGNEVQNIYMASGDSEYIFGFGGDDNTEFHNFVESVRWNNN